MERIDEYIRNARSLPPAPKALPQLMQLLGKTDVDSDKVVRLIQFEPALTAKILQVTNSSTFGASRQIADIDEAITRIGFGEVFRVVASIVSQQALNGTQQGYGLGRGELWGHSAVTAVASRLIAQACGVDENLAFTGGLLHDLGKIVLASVLESAYEQIVKETEQKNRSLLEAEREILGTDHAECGARLLEQWKFPEELVEGVRWHHDPARAPNHQRLTACVYLGNVVSNFTGFAFGFQPFALHGRTEAIQILGLNPDSISLFMIKTLEEAKSAPLPAAA